MRTLPQELKGPAAEAEDPVEQRAGDLAGRNLPPVEDGFNPRDSAPPVPEPEPEEPALPLGPA